MMPADDARPSVMEIKAECQETSEVIYALPSPPIAATFSPLFLHPNSRPFDPCHLLTRVSLGSRASCHALSQ